ncbi:MAG: hypothetical protein CME31_01215 [Gimesia sp.]|jgi:hypothetical protein|nr:hypothetical protein [Gimesia sp.]
MAIVRVDRYVMGTHNSISDLSGQKYKRKDMRLQWNNLLVGIDEWSPKQPQLTIRARRDSPSIKNQTRTQDQTETLLDPTFNPAGEV